MNQTTLGMLMDLLTPSNPLYDAMEDPEDLNEAVVDIFERLLATVARRYQPFYDQAPIICHGNKPEVAEMDATVGRAFLSRLGLERSEESYRFLSHFASSMVGWGARGGTIPGVHWTLKGFGYVGMSLVANNER